VERGTRQFFLVPGGAENLLAITYQTIEVVTADLTAEFMAEIILFLNIPNY
jgi:hypothetical protein